MDDTKKDKDIEAIAHLRAELEQLERRKRELITDKKNSAKDYNDQIKDVDDQIEQVLLELAV